MPGEDPKVSLIPLMLMDIFLGVWRKAPRKAPTVIFIEADQSKKLSER